MKSWIWWKLTYLRDKDWCPFVGLIDWLRYHVFYPEEKE